jgi:3-methyladenine DNA glycosylase AlkD
VNSDALISDLQADLAARADPKTKDWWDRYLRNAIEFRGVKMAAIRSAVRSWLDRHGLVPDSDGTKDLAYRLIEETPAEDKLAGILLLAEWLLPAGSLDCGADVHRLARLFDEGHIADWNTCDWLCVKVLGPLALANGEACAAALADWHTAAGVWRSRAAAVAFVNLLPAAEEPIPGLRRLVLGVCRANVRRRERFSQTGVGWTVRELSRGDPASAAAFVEEHLPLMSREAIRSATAKLPDGVRDRLLDAHARLATGTP